MVGAVGGGDPRAARLADVVATLRGFVARSGAARATLLYDQGEGPPALVECPAEGPVLVGEGEVERAIPDPDALGGEPLGEPHAHALPPFEVDAEAGELRGVLGGLDSYGRAVRELAQLFPGRSAVTVEWESSDPAAPLMLAARGEEPMVLALGETQFELPDGFPAPPQGASAG